MIIASEYVKHGFALVPIPLGTKGPVQPGWNLPENAVTTTDAAEKMNGNVGLLHAYCSQPTACIDIDNLTTTTILLDAEGVNIVHLIDAHDAVLISSGRPNRAKLLYRLPENNIPLETIKINDPKTGESVVEFRCASSNGKSMQDVLPPSIHPETGKEYIWAGQGHWSKLPEMPAEILEYWTRQLKQRGTSNRTTSTGSVTNPAITLPPETIQYLRSALLHMRSDGRETWIKVGMALHELGETGRGLWLEWSVTSEKYDASDAARTWDSFSPTSIGHKFVFAEAQRQGWVNPTKSIFRDQVDAVFDLQDIEPTELKPQKLPAPINPVPLLDPEHLPEPLINAAIDLSERLQCPIDYIAAAMICSAGAVVGNRIGIYPLANDESWVVFPCLWGGVVGHPGTKKSPAINSALAPLKNIEQKLFESYGLAYQQYKIDLERYQLELAEWKKKKTGLFPVQPIEPKQKRLSVNDTTYQALGEVLANNPGGVMILSDELSGLLQSLDAPGQEAARGFYLTGWGGNNGYSFDRIGRGSVILHRYCLSLFGGFQPDRIKTYVQAAQKGSSKNDGFLQRFQVIVWPDPITTTDIIDRSPDKAAMDAFNLAIHKLYLTATMSAQDERTSSPLMLHFTVDAQQLFTKWYLKNEKLVAGKNLDTSRQSHFAKYRSLIPALALLFHLLEGGTGPVEIGVLGKAIRYANYLKGHANRVYGSVLGFDHAPAHSLAEKLINGKINSDFTSRTVLLKGWSDLTTNELVHDALNTLVEYGWLEAGKVETGGRPKVTYKIMDGVIGNTDLL
jgi:hypothetical protein